MSQENVEVAVKQFEGTNARDFAGVMDTWADDVTLIVHWLSGQGRDTATGKAAPSRRSSLRWPACCSTCRFVDWLNFGDLVRVGPPADAGTRPILEVVKASDHRRVMAAIGEHPMAELMEHLRERFPGDYALRMEGGFDELLSVSVHPDTDPEAVFDAMADWLNERGAQDDDDVSISPVFETVVGPVEWPGD